MRTPTEIWTATSDDPRWIDDQPAILAEIMREAFAAGFAEGCETTARGIDGHAARLGSNIPLPMLPAIPRGLVALADISRQLSRDPAILEAAWKRCGAGQPSAAKRSA